MSTVPAVTANAGPRTAVVLFTRDLRVHDHPALAAAVERAERVLPLFVLDEAILARFGATNRVAFLLDSLHDLDARLRARGGGLVVRSGSVVGETSRLAVDVGAEAVYASEDVSAYAQERERRLRRTLAGSRIALETFPGVTVVPPGDLAPADADHYRVFTPYWRRWREQPRRDVLPPPVRIALPDGVDAGLTAGLGVLAGGTPASELPAAGSRPGADASMPGSTTGSPATARSRTTWAPMRLRASRPISTSAASPPARWSHGRSSAKVRSRSYGSCAGATSTTSCWRRAPRPRTRPAAAPWPVARRR